MDIFRERLAAITKETERNFILKALYDAIDDEVINPALVILAKGYIDVNGIEKFEDLYFEETEDHCEFVINLEDIEEVLEEIL